MAEDTPTYVRFKRDDPIVIGVVDPISMQDMSHMRGFADQAASVVKRRPGTALLLDFERIAFVSSAALSELIRIKEAAEGADGTLRICGVSPEIAKVFEITKLDGAFGLKAGEPPVEAARRFKADVASRAAQEA